MKKEEIEEMKRIAEAELEVYKATDPLYLKISENSSGPIEIHGAKYFKGTLAVIIDRQPTYAKANDIKVKIKVTK